MAVLGGHPRPEAVDATGFALAPGIGAGSAHAALAVFARAVAVSVRWADDVGGVSARRRWQGAHGRGHIAASPVELAICRVIPTSKKK